MSGRGTPARKVTFKRDTEENIKVETSIKREKREVEVKGNVAEAKGTGTLPYLMVKCGGVSVKTLIDTGASASLLSKRKFLELKAMTKDIRLDY
jgi:hypothetical protein